MKRGTVLRELTIAEQMQVRLFTELLKFRRYCIDPEHLDLNFEVVTLQKFMVIRSPDLATLRRLKTDVVDVFFDSQRKPFVSRIQGNNLVVSFSGWIPFKATELTLGEIGEELLR